ncbi:MAG: hypothetical protein RL385_2012 [Pseudomonadota bacterium]|jgi:hypothetical protein
MTMRFTRSLVLIAGAAALAACDADSAASSAEQDTSFGLREQQLETQAMQMPVQSCQEQLVTCTGAANDVGALGACRSDFGACLSTSQTQILSIGGGLGQCRDARNACITKGGASGAGSCLSEFGTCLQGLVTGSGVPGTLPGVLQDGAVPSLPSFDGGIALPTLPEAGLSLPAGFDAGLALPVALDAGFALPSGINGGLPNVGDLLGDAGLGNLGGTFPTLPGQGPGALDLFGDAGLSTTGVPGGDCVRDLNSCATAGTDLTDCADQARTCLEKRLMAP